MSRYPDLAPPYLGHAATSNGPPMGTIIGRPPVQTVNGQPPVGRIFNRVSHLAPQVGVLVPQQNQHNHHNNSHQAFTHAHSPEYQIPERMSPVQPHAMAPIEPLSFYESPSRHSAASGQRPEPSRASGQDYDSMWDRALWQQQYANAVATGQDLAAKSMRAQVAEHNYGMWQQRVGALGPVPETILATYDVTSHTRVPGTGREPTISFSATTTGAAMGYFARSFGRKVCGLNFANGEHVGGGYVRGAKAQEEDLCRTCPLLYTSLRNAKKRKLYPYGPPAGERGYSDVLFTPRVLVCRGEESEGYRMLRQEERFTCSIVSAAAPNLKKGEPFDRVRFVNAIKNMIVAPRIYAPELNVLLLGAWGCGAFGGDPVVVARCYIEVLRLPIAKIWKEIHFPIPNASDNDNARVFHATLIEAFPNMEMLNI